MPQDVQFIVTAQINGSGNAWGFTAADVQKGIQDQLVNAFHDAGLLILGFSVVAKPLTPTSTPPPPPPPIP